MHVVEPARGRDGSTAPSTATSWPTASSASTMRELGDGTVREHDLRFVRYHAHWLRCASMEGPALETPRERRVFWRCLGGFLRHACSGSRVPEHHREMCAQATRLIM